MSDENAKERPLRAISPRDLLVYLCLRKHMNGETAVSAVPVSVMAKETSSSPVTVLGSLGRLEKSGHIIREKRGRANCYVLVSCISAESYEFLDEDMPYIDKQSAAVRAAYVSDSGETEGPDSRLYDFVVRLEEELVKLRAELRRTAKETDTLRKSMSLLTGKAYVPFSVDL